MVECLWLGVAECLVVIFFVAVAFTLKITLTGRAHMSHLHFLNLFIKRNPHDE